MVGRNSGSLLISSMTTSNSPPPPPPPPPFAQGTAHGTPGAQREAVPASDPGHVHAVDDGVRRASRPAARDEVDVVPPFGDAPEQLVQMDFGAAGVWVLPVVPVDEQNPHSAPVSWAMASRTPLMKAGAREPANQAAGWTPS